MQMNPENIQTINFLERLRADTADSHKNLEKLPLSMSIMSPTVSAEAYALYLNRMHDVVKDTEENIFPLLQNVFSDLEERRKLQFINDDLAFLNAPKTDSKSPFELSEKVSIPFAIGILYVVEGSSLGGRFILKNLQAALGYDQNGVSYFNGYGNKTGSSWKHFLNVLTAYEEQNNAGEAIIAGADFAFQAIHRHFSN